MRKRNRRLIVVDIENLAGGPGLHAQLVDHIRRAVTDATQPGPNDLVVVGSSHYAFTICGFAWPGVRHVVRSGPDGADQALLEVLGEDVEHRFTRVCIASGDGVFADAAARLTGYGVHVTALARPQTLSRRLRLATAATTYLPGFHDLTKDIA